MALYNLAEWADGKAATSCGTACGAPDEPEEKPSACGSACGASDKPEKTPSACGASDK